MRRSFSREERRIFYIYYLLITPKCFMEITPTERQTLLRNVFDTVAHDFNTPLACIIGSLEILEQMPESLSTEQRNALIHTALMEAHRLNHFIAEILEKNRPA
jgi:K+-sensing histidine kinase KdpD